jgi:hypothetical protein
MTLFRPCRDRQLHQRICRSGIVGLSLLPTAAGERTNPASRKESAGFHRVEARRAQAYEEHFYQHRDGMIDEARWATSIRRLRSMSASPGYRAAWRVASGRMFESDFADWVNKIINETPAGSGLAVSCVLMIDTRNASRSPPAAETGKPV